MKTLTNLDSNKVERVLEMTHFSYDRCPSCQANGTEDISFVSDEDAARFEGLYTELQDLSDTFGKDVENMKQKEGEAVIVHENTYEQFRGSVPPMALKDITGGFACGEVYSGNTYYCFTKVNGIYYGILATRAEARKQFEGINRV